MEHLNNLFEHPEYLFLLLIIPLAGVVWSRSQQRMRQRIQAMGAPDTIRQMLVRNWFTKTEFFWVVAGLFFLIVALANPRVGTKKEKTKAKAAEIVYLLDISNSMNAADLSPSRMARARYFLSDLVQSRKGDLTALIFFAGEAYLQMPFTSDYAAADMFVRSASTSQAGTQGTAIGEAIRLATERVREKRPRAMVIISDGEDHDNDAIEGAKEAADDGWKIFTIGAGTPKGGQVPQSDEAGAPARMLEDGSPVISALNESLLEEIAFTGGGAYFPLQDEENLVRTLGEQLDKLVQQETEVRSFTAFECYYQYFLAVGLLCILLSLFLPTMYRHRKILLLLLFVGPAGLLVGSSQSAHSTLRKADRHYDNREYPEAEKQYRKAAEAGGESSYNLGNTLLSQNRAEEAVRQYESAIKKNSPPDQKADAYHNLGNTYYQLQQYDKSIEAYKEALKANPSAEDTRKNLAMAQWQQKKQLRQQQQQQKNQDNQKKQQQNQQPQDDKKGPPPPADDKTTDKKQQKQQNPGQQPQSGGEPRPDEPTPAQKDPEIQKWLQIMDQEERRVQQKLNKGKGTKKPKDKDW